MPDVSAPQSVPEGEGASASMPFGAAQQFQAQNHALTSQGGGGSPPAGLTPGPGGPPGASMPPQSGPAQPPSQGSGPQPGGNGRLDMNAVFPPMPEMDLRNQMPWRDQLRTWAEGSPGASSLRLLADQIKDQRGPYR